MSCPPSGLPTTFLTRSWLLIPPIEEAAIRAGLVSGTDVIVFDFTVIAEDGRRMAAERLAGLLGDLPDRKTLPALFFGLPAPNGETEDLLSDLMPLRPDGFMLMQLRERAEVQALDVMITAEETVLGRSGAGFKIAALMAHANDHQLAGLSERLVALGWSADALLRLTGARRMHDANGHLTDAFRQARASVLIAAAEAGVEALDTVSGLFSTDRLARDCQEAAADGFTGKLALSPRQVTSINHGFQPTEEDVLKAQAEVQSGESRDLSHKRALQVLRRAEPGSS